MRRPEDIESDLSRPLDPKRIMTVKKGRKGELSYLASADCIRAANRIFGFGGWSTGVPEIVYQAVEPLDGRRLSITVVVAQTVTVHAEGIHATFGDVGSHSAIGSADDPDIIGDCFKAAASDALKRCLRHLGDQFGLGLYQGPDEILPDANGRDQQEPVVRVVYDDPEPAKRRAIEKWKALGWPSLKQSRDVLSIVRKALGNPAGSDYWSDLSALKAHHWERLCHWLDRMAERPDLWPAAFRPKAP